MMVDLAGTLLDHGLLFATQTWQLFAALALIALALRAGAEPVLRRLLLKILRILRRMPPLIAVIVSLAVNVWVFAARGEPLPELHDDYSQLLLADTLARGRLANAPHPLAAHFETMLVLQRPTYASHFPPATAALMAATSVTIGLPIAGIWLATAAMAGVVCWTARCWLPPSWSLLTAVLVAAHPTIVEWGVTYTGGSISFLAGAVLVGATVRLARNPSQASGALAAGAMVVLANSRPFEGLIFTLAVAIAFVVYARGSLRGVIRHSAAGIAILGAGAASILLYNRAVTGDPYLLPHAAHDRQYNPAQNFIWERPKEPREFPNLEIETAFKSVYLVHDRRRREPGGQWCAYADKLDVFRWSLFPRPVAWSNVGRASLLLYAPLLLLPTVSRRRRRTRLLIVVVLTFLAAPAMTAWWASPHYLSPAGVVVAILYMLCLRQLFVRNATLTFALLTIAVWLSVEGIAAQAGDIQNPSEARRRQLAAALMALPGDDLVLVPKNIFGWVYNEADIDGAPVLWARDLGENSALLAYFADRRVWKLEKQDDKSYQLQPLKRR